MSARKAVLVALAFVLALAAGQSASAAGRRDGNATRRETTAPPERPRAEITVDLVSGRVLAERGADVPVRPASLAKLMTLELLFTAMDAGLVAPDTSIVISRRAASMPPSRLGLPAGSSIRAEDAALCLAVRSCNDVAVAVAEHLAGSEAQFAVAMTQAARRFGLARTRFANASGLPDPGNTTTARDLALLGATLMARHPHHWRYLGVGQWGIAGREFRNTSRLIGSHPMVDGGKTGFIAASGFNMFASAAAGDRRVLVVVIGRASAADRDARVAELVEAALGIPGG